MWAVVSVVVSVVVAVGGCWGAEGEPAVAKYMLRAEDVPGGGEVNYPNRVSNLTVRCNTGSSGLGVWSGAQSVSEASGVDEGSGDVVGGVAESLGDAS